MEALLHKFLNNEPLTEDELLTLQRDEEYSTYLKLASHASGYVPPKLDETALFQKINALKSQDKLPKIITDKKDPKIRFLNTWLPIASAACILLFFLGYYFTNTTSLETTITQKGQQKEITLPDGSTVLLNALSSISYDKNNWEEERSINLEGQAYFNVAKGSKFSVKTNQGLVQVLGTQFVVNDRDGLYEVTCYEGKVSVLAINKKVILTRGQSAALTNDDLRLNSLSTQNKTFLPQESHFYQTPFYQVIAEFERQYDVTFTYDKSMRNILFTGSFANNDMAVALASIAATMNTNYSIKERQVFLTN